MADVSIIVPVYNVEKYIRPSVQSMLDQTYRDIEIILVDDGSGDSSGRICDEFAARDSRVRVIHKENGGTGAARNTGFDAATGEYVYFCDPDDILEKELIEENLALARSSGADIEVFGYRTVYERSEGNRRGKDCAPVLSGVFTREDFAKNFDGAMENVYAIGARMYRREFMLENNIRSEAQKFGQDVLLILDALTAPFEKIYFNRKIYYNYLLRAGSATNRYAPERFECELNIARRKEILVRSLEKYGVFREELIYKGYLQSVNAAFGSFSVWDAPAEMPFRERVDILRRIFSAEEIKTAAEKAAYPKLKYLGAWRRMFLIKHKMCRTMVLIGYIEGKRHRSF